MTEIRSYASLSGSLLARKGAAKPAMRPRPFTESQMLDDLGWDDMGQVLQPAEHVPSSITALTPAPKPAASRDEPEPVHIQQQALAEHFGEPEAAEVAEPAEIERSETVVAPLPMPRKPRRPRAAAGDGKKAAFTLRLDPDRHLQLRLASAVTGRSAQQLVTTALDTFLTTLPELGTLAQQLPRRAARKS